MTRPIATVPAAQARRPHAQLADQLVDEIRARFRDAPEGAWAPDRELAVALGDLATGLVDAYAAALHVLWTYEEAWAEEGYLPTARLDASADRLLATLGYHLGPGTAAEGLLHIRCRAGAPTTLAAGFPVASPPSSDGSESAAVFETTRPVTIHPDLNELRALPSWGLAARPQLARTAAAGVPRVGRPGADPIAAAVGPAGPPTLAGAIAAHLDDQRLGDEAAVRAAKARQDVQRLGEMVRLAAKHGGVEAGQCAAVTAVCQALCAAQDAASAAPDPADRRLGALSDSQEAVARQLKRMASRPGDGVAFLEKALGPSSGDDAEYGQRLAAMATFLDGFVAGLMQDARDQVVLLRGRDALERLDRSLAGATAESRLGRVPPGTDTLFVWAGGPPGRGVPLESLRPGDWLVVGEDVVSVDAQGQETRTRAHRQAVQVRRLQSERPAGLLNELTQITFAPALARGYDLDRAVILGNLAPITEGATVEQPVERDAGERTEAERLGEAGGVVIARGPVTFVRSVGEVGGRRPEVSLLVDDRPWRRVETLLTASPNDTVFTVEQLPGGGARLRVGDGRRWGAALPPDESRRARVRYRVGLGASGNRAAGRVSDVVRAHGSVEQVFNPLPLAGGTDPEPRALARVRGPMIAAAMDRAVSAEDLRAMSLVFDGVTRARVFIGGTHRRAIARVVVSGPGGAPLSPELLAALQAHLAVRVPPGVSVAVENRTLVALRARVLLRLEKSADPMAVVRRVRVRLGVDRVDGEPRGLLDPDRVDLDDDLALSQLYGALEGIAGLHSVVVKELYRADGAAGLHERVETAPREMLAWAGGAGVEPVSLPFEEVVDL